MLLEGCPLCPLVLALVGLRKGSEKNWLLELLHYGPPGLIFCHLPQIQSSIDPSFLSASLFMWCVLTGRGSFPPLDISYSSFQAYVKCYLLREAFLDAPQLGYRISLCISQLCCAFIIVLKAAVASKYINCFTFLSFPTRLRVS